MRKLILAITLFIAFAVNAQVTPSNPQPALKGIQYQRVYSQYVQPIPRNSSHTDIDTTPHLYVFSDGIIYQRINGVSTPLGNNSNYDTAYARRLQSIAFVSGTLSATLGSGQVLTATGIGTVTSFSFTNSTGITGIVTGSTITPTLSLTIDTAAISNFYAKVRSLFTAGTGMTFVNGAFATTITQYTDALARASLSFTAGSGAYNSSTGVITIPTNTSQLTNGAGFITTNQNITLTGVVTGSGALTITTTITNSSVTNAMLAGSIDLTTKVTGTLPVANGGTGQTTLQTAINSLAGAVTSATFLRGNGTNVVMAAIQASDVPTLNQNTTGSAATLTTARNINGVAFNGSANITITATATNALTIGTHLTGTSYNGSSGVTIATDAVSTNTVSTIVARDGSGNFSAGTITATLTGTASNATTWNGETYNGNLSGDAVDGIMLRDVNDAKWKRGLAADMLGYLGITGTGFVKISGTTISIDNSTYLTTASAASTYLPLTAGATKTLTGILYMTTAGAHIELNGTDAQAYVALLNNGSNDWAFGTNLGVSSQDFRIYNYGTSSSPFIINKTTNAVTLSGSLSASNFSGSSSGTNTGDQTTITGNAGSATVLQTARNIQGVSFNGSANIDILNGTGFVKVSGTTVSYDNSTYLTTSTAASTYLPLAAGSSTPLTGILYTSHASTGAMGVVIRNGSTDKWGVGKSFGSSDESFNIYNYGLATRSLLINVSTNDWDIFGKLAVNGSSLSGTVPFSVKTGANTMIYINQADANTVSIDAVRQDNAAIKDLLIQTTGGQTYFGAGKVIINGADGDTRNFNIRGSTGRLVIDPYIDATNGAVINSYNTAESGYKPMTFQASQYYFLQGSVRFGLAPDIVMASAHLSLNGTDGQAYIYLGNNGSNDWVFGTQLGAADQNFAVYNYGTSTRAFQINKSTNAVTCVASVTATSFLESSDLRYKDILYRVPSADGFDMIAFTWKVELKRDKLLHYGYVAQEVFKILPDQVQTDEAGFKAVNYTDVLVYKIAQLEKRINELEKTK